MSWPGLAADGCQRSSEILPSDLPPAVRPPVEFAHADKLVGVTPRVSGAGGQYCSALRSKDKELHYRTHLKL